MDGVFRMNAGNLAMDLLRILKNNSPVRSTRGKSGASPYPGNLKNNGIYTTCLSTKVAIIHVGGEPAPYAIYTETKSRKKGWQKKSEQEFLTQIQQINSAKITR